MGLITSFNFIKYGHLKLFLTRDYTSVYNWLDRTVLVYDNLQPFSKGRTISIYLIYIRSDLCLHITIKTRFSVFNLSMDSFIVIATNLETSFDWDNIVKRTSWIIILRVLTAIGKSCIVMFIRV